MSSVVLAKALYNNVSEADDELSFNKGDVITVLETDFDGMVGWWLCSLGDKQGVAPGNRLQLISFDDSVTDTDGPQEIYDTPGQAYKEKYGDVDYDVPKPYSPSQYEDYAIPKTPFGNYSIPDSQRHGFVLPSPRVVPADNERNSNSSDGLVTNEIYTAPSSRYSSERSSDEFRFSGEMFPGSGSEYDAPSRNSIESDDGQRNLSLQLPAIPPKGKRTSNGSHGSSISRQGSQEIYDSPAGVAQDVAAINRKYSDYSDDVYDQLPGNIAKPLTQPDDNEDYATIPSPRLAGPQDIYDVPPAALEEFYDTLPSGPEEVYDVPPTGLGEVYDVPPAGPEAFYDELPSVDKPESIYKRNSFEIAADGNNNPPVLPGSTSINEAVYEEVPERSYPEAVYDNFAESENGVMAAGSTGSLSRKKRHESDDYVDYQEIYGIVDEDTTKKGDAQKKEQSVLDRIHMDKVRELRVSHLVAMHNLDKLQQAVDVAVTKLMSFVTEDWRRSEVYALNINGIREISGKVKVALRLLTEFGLGALKNSQKLTNNDISGKIEEALKPLLESYYSIKSSIQRLDESNWRSAYQERPDDDLHLIANLAQLIPCGAYNLGAVIANVSCILFTTENQDETSSRKDTAVTQNGTHNLLSPTAAQNNPTKRPEARSSPDPVSPSPIMTQVESTRKPASSKMETEPVGNQAKSLMQTTKTPPPVSAKPTKERKRSDSAPNSVSLSEQVSELTNNLLNQIDFIKTPPTGLCRKGSKKLSPRTVRKLCSITLKNEDRINEKIFEDVSAIPPKPSRQSSSPATPDSTTTMFDRRPFLTETKSDPGNLHSSENILQSQSSFQNLKSFVEKMNSEFMVLKEAMKCFGESVKDRQKPKVFVAHSKFIVLSAHKLVYIGDGASRNVPNVNDRNTISSVTNSLSEVINGFVENIKIAARQYPEEAAMNTMIKSATNVTEKALALYKAVKRHAQS